MGIYEERKINNVSTAISLFLKKDCYIEEIAKIMEVSSSSVQRYLNDPIATLLFSKEEIEKVQNKLAKNKERGVKKGGITSQLKNQYVKTRYGRFNGCKKI